MTGRSIGGLSLSELPAKLPVSSLPMHELSAGGVLKALRPTPWRELSTARKVRRVVGIIAQLGAVGMAVSAATSGNEVGLRSDGSLAKEHRDEIDKVEGDPKNKAQRDQAGEQKQPADPHDAAELSDAPGTEDGPNASDQHEAQGGNAAEDTQKAAESTS